MPDGVVSTARNDYELSDSEAEKVISFCFQDLSVTEKDFHVIKSLWRMYRRDGDHNPWIAGDKSVQILIRISCEYLWDHLMGEPEEPSQQQIIDAAYETVQEWLKQKPGA